MSPERWERVAEVFEEALDSSPEEREAVLEAGGPELRQAVESLLEAEQEAEDFMENPLVEASGEAVTSVKALLSKGRRVGPYRLLRQIGQGGMSTVFLAVRDDEFRRRVAIKVIRKGMESDDALRRLRTERQILASLHHPYIAELYDGGTTGEGLPYFVMEYIAGKPIDEHCDHRQLTVGRRIELFRKVCEAVQYAHQNLVVHRDLKPSNILVTPDGVPKLLDFGIAKLLNPELLASEIEPTATWVRIMTPHFASPEQIRGDLITTSSDVYSLGVLLYKLLTGRLPHQFEGRTRREIEEEITNEEPSRPSTAFSRKVEGSRSRSDPKTETSATVDARARGRRPDQLRQELAGDLDTIVLKALRPYPHQRYRSVDALAEDLERYRLGYPVLGRQGNLRYRIGKYLRRNWAPVLAAASVVVLTLALGTTMALQSAVIARERDQAQRERDEKEQVLALVQDIFQLADPGEARGETFTVREALDRSAVRIVSRLESQPAVEAALRHAIGTIYLNLGLFDQAKLHLERALEITREHFGEESLEVARELAAVGSVLREKGDYDEAQVLAEEALSLTRRRVGSDDPRLIDVLNDLSTLFCYKGDYEAADPPSREALSLARKHLDETRSGMAEAVINRAVVLKSQGDLDGAEAMYREAVRIQRIVGGADHPTMANVLNNLAVVLRVRGNFTQAEQLHRETLALRRKLYGEAHPSVAQSLANLASVLRDQGELEQAETALAEALGILDLSLGRAHPVTIAVATELASVRLDNGSVEPAVRLLRERLETWREQLPPDHRLRAWAENTLGAALSLEGRFEEAEELLVQSWEILKRHGDRHDRTRLALERLVALYEAWSKPETAEYYRRLQGGRSPATDS